MAEILQGGKRDTVSTAQFAVKNITEDYALDCNANKDLATADVLGTLIRELIRKGLINGTVA
jgi:hypothetical protein